MFYTPDGKPVPNANVSLRYRGKTIAAAKSSDKGAFTVTGLRGGTHNVVVGSLISPVRLWANGTAPKSASRGLVVAASETVVRGQDMYCDTCPPGPVCPPSGPTGFGLLDVITLATVGTATGALVVGLDNRDTLKDIKAAVASP